MKTAVQPFSCSEECRGGNSVGTNLKDLCFSQTMGEIVLPRLKTKPVSNSTSLLFALKARYFLSVPLQVLNAILYLNLNWDCISPSVTIQDIGMH